MEDGRCQAQKLKFNQLLSQFKAWGLHPSKEPSGRVFIVSNDVPVGTLQATFGWLFFAWSFNSVVANAYADNALCETKP